MYRTKTYTGLLKQMKMSKFFNLLAEYYCIRKLHPGWDFLGGNGAMEQDRSGNVMSYIQHYASHRRIKLAVVTL